VVTTPPATRVLTTSEAAVLALLALGGEGSGYELTKRVGRAIAHVWAPARSQLYALLPRLVADGHVDVRTVRQRTRPDKQVYTLTDDGRAALDGWLADEGGGEAEFHLRLFVGSLVPRETLVGHVERFRAATAARMEEYRRIEPRNTREGADRFHWFELHRAIERSEGDVAWADWVLKELERE
jgi:PadR family transcriptional regulator, regulatory protein AphA